MNSVDEVDFVPQYNYPWGQLLLEQISSSQDKIPGDMSQGSVPGLDSTSQLSCLETMICKMNYMNIWGVVTPSNTLLRRQRISGDSPLLPRAIVIY